MDELILYLVLLLFIAPLLGIFLFAMKKKSKGILVAWAEFARRKNLNFDSQSGVYPQRVVHGLLDGFPFILGSFREGRYSVMSIEVGLLGAIPKSLFLGEKEKNLEDAQKAMFGEEVDVGDPDFNRKVYVGGDPQPVQSYLNESRRAAAEKLIDEGGQVIGNVLRYSKKKHLSTQEELDALVDFLLEISKILSATNADKN